MNNFWWQYIIFCREAGCHKTKIEYKPKMDEIVAAMNLSAECHQHIQINCTGVPLGNFSWWTDRENEKHHYWDGDFSDKKDGCKCRTGESGCNPNLYGVKVNFDNLKSNSTDSSHSTSI